MEDLMDMIISDGSPAEISDHIKNILYTKSAEKIELIRPSVAASLFNKEEE